eukprot:5077074-Pleurochrysis_carterae.AAC.4
MQWTIQEQQPTRARSKNPVRATLLDNIPMHTSLLILLSICAFGSLCERWGLHGMNGTYVSLTCICPSTLTSWRIAFQRQFRRHALCSSSSMRTGRKASTFRHSASRRRRQPSFCAHPTVVQ